MVGILPTLGRCLPLSVYEKKRAKGANINVASCVSVIVHFTHLGLYVANKKRERIRVQPHNLYAYSPPNRVSNCQGTLFLV